MRRPLCLAAAFAGALAIPAAAPAQDDCGAASYCLPAPPASSAQKHKAASGARKAIGRPVLLVRQTGVSLVYRPEALQVPPVTRSLAIYCPSRCVIGAAQRLTAGAQSWTLPDWRTTLGAGSTASAPISLSTAQRRAVARPGKASLVTIVTVRDDYGTHDTTVTQTVRTR